MIEKRFEWIDKDTISDNQTDEWYCFLFDDIRDDFVDLLNEQQSRIEELKTHNLQHFLEWLVIKGYVTDEQMKDINHVIDCVNEFKEYVTEFEKELLDNGK